MNETTENIMNDKTIEAKLLDLASMVGREIVIYCDQYPGKPLSTRVIMANNYSMAVDRGKSSGLIDELVNDQRVIMQFDYRGELVSVDAQLNRSPGGQCTLTLADKVVPLTRRRFRRYPIERLTRLAVFNAKTFDHHNLSRLRWIETKSLNISCGGMLLGMSSQIRSKTYFLLNIEMNSPEFPKFVIGQVRHSIHGEDGRYHTGIEFIVSEKKARHFSQFTIKELPEAFFEYTIPQRINVSKQLAAWKPGQGADVNRSTK